MPDYINIMGVGIVIMFSFICIFYAFIQPLNMSNRCANICYRSDMDFSHTEIMENETKCFCDLDNLTIQV